MASRRPGLVEVSIGASISIGLGLAFAILVAIGAHRTPPLVGAVAFGALYAMPGVLAIIGYRLRRPALVLAAALAALPLGVLLLSVVVVVLLISCVCFNVAYARIRGERWFRDVGMAIAVAALVASSIPLFFLREDPRCWAVVRRDGVERVVDIAPNIAPDGGIRLGSGRRGNEPRGTVESGCTSDVISTLEGTSALMTLAAALGVALGLTKGVDRWDRSSERRIELAKAHAAGYTIRRP
jgi:hypothetical protein